MRRIIPYGRQEVDEDDIAAVVEVLRGDWLTTGPAVTAFEQAFADFVGASHAAAVINGTAALHVAMLAAGVGPGDEVIVPTFTFAASANAARYVGADVVLCDVLSDTLSIDVEDAARRVTGRTKAIVPVDYAGMPCALDQVMALADAHDLIVVEDACHAVGATHLGRPIGSVAHLTTFSFHPVKHLTTGEGGMVTTQSEKLDARVRMFRNHGIETDFRQREVAGTWEYDVAELGYNFRLSDVSAALGSAQLKKVAGWVERRRQLASRYRELLGPLPVRTLVEPEEGLASWHLFPVLLEGDDAENRRASVFAALRDSGINVNVHYRPVHHHTSFRGSPGCSGPFPVADDAYARLISMPMWHGLKDDEQERSVASLADAIASSGAARVG